MKKILLLSTLLPISVALADSCNNLTINVANVTGQTCKLIASNVVHGKYDGDAAPSEIIHGESKTFKMTTIGVYGPEIELAYRCGSGSVKFTSQQNYCAFAPGDVTGTVSEPLDGVKGEYIPDKGTATVTSGTHGTINWTLSPEN